MMNEAYVAYLLESDQWTHPALFKGETLNPQLHVLLTLIRQHNPNTLAALFLKSKNRQAIAYAIEIMNEYVKKTF